MYTTTQEDLIKTVMRDAWATIARADIIIKSAEAIMSQAVRPVVENKVTAGDIDKVKRAALATLLPLNIALETVMSLGSLVESARADSTRHKLYLKYFADRPHDTYFNLKVLNFRG